MMDAYDKALPYRLVFGLCFFAAMAAWAYFREGWKSMRLREYAFLVAATFASIAYAVAHDQLTATISSEYFLIAKGLQQDPRPYRLAVASRAPVDQLEVYIPPTDPVHALGVRRDRLRRGHRVDLVAGRGAGTLQDFSWARSAARHEDVHDGLLR